MRPGEGLGDGDGDGLGEGDGEGLGDGEGGAPQAPSESPWPMCADTAGCATVSVWPLWQIVTFGWPVAAAVPSSAAPGADGMATGWTGLSAPHAASTPRSTSSGVPHRPQFDFIRPDASLMSR